MLVGCTTGLICSRIALQIALVSRSCRMERKSSLFSADY
jgi:hypothetical protein